MSEYATSCSFFRWPTLSSRPGVGSARIASQTVAAMKADRHKEILSHLSFIKVGATDVPLTDKMRKLRSVDDGLCARVTGSVRRILQGKPSGACNATI